MGVKLNADTLAKQIKGAHAMLAVAMKSPTLAITDDEAQMLAVATIDVGKQYAVEISPKTVAWLNMGGALLGIWGPRFLMYTMTKKPKGPGAPPVAQRDSAQDAAHAATTSGASASPLALATGKMNFGG